MGLLKDKGHWIKYCSLKQTINYKKTTTICDNLVTSQKQGIILYEYQMKYTEYKSHSTVWIMQEEHELCLS